MLITWLDFGGILLKTFFAKLSLKISDVFFSRSNTIGHISGMVGPIVVKQKGGASVGYWVKYVTSTFDLTHDPDRFFKVKFKNSCILRIVILIDVKQIESKSIRYWADSMVLPFDHTHDFDLAVSRSKFERALFEEWDGWLTWKEMDVSGSFMTMEAATGQSPHLGIHILVKIDDMSFVCFKKWHICLIMKKLCNIAFIDPFLCTWVHLSDFCISSMIWHFPAW